MSEAVITLLAFCGGIFGASIGGLWAFILCALIAVLGCLVVLAGGTSFILLDVALGPIFGPAAGGFLSGVVATTYAKAKGNQPTDNAKDILTPLMGTSWDVLCVGGVAAVICYYMTKWLAYVPIIGNGDTGAVSIVILSLLARFIFLKEGPFGCKESIDKHGLMGTDNYSISWCGYMTPPMLLLTIGAAMGGVSAAVAHGLSTALEPLVLAGVVEPATARIVPLFFMWGISGVMLTMMALGQGAIGKVPVTHAMSLAGALMYLQTAPIYGANVAIMFGVLGGIMGMAAQELGARLFWNHGSNHVDPPAFSIAVTTIVINTFFSL